MKQPLINRLLANFTYRCSFNRKALNIAATDLLREEILRQHASQKSIAKKLGISPARVSQILNMDDDGNLTLNTLADMASALDMRFSLSLSADRHAQQPEKPLLVSVGEAVGKSESVRPFAFKDFRSQEVVYES